MLYVDEDNEATYNFYGKIGFYSMNGEVMEILYYENKKEFDKEIKDSYEIGRPIRPQILAKDNFIEDKLVGNHDEEMEME